MCPNIDTFIMNHEEGANDVEFSTEVYPVASANVDVRILSLDISELFVITNECLIMIFFIIGLVCIILQILVFFYLFVCIFIVLVLLTKSWRIV